MANRLHNRLHNDIRMHCANGPAYMNLGEWTWYLFGHYHRYYGPCDHMGEWYIWDKFIK